MENPDLAAFGRSEKVLESVHENEEWQAIRSLLPIRTYSHEPVFLELPSLLPSMVPSLYPSALPVP